jgi:hypothetical protein
MTGHLYRWKLILKNGQKEQFNMPGLREPTEEEIKSFLRTFMPRTFLLLAELPGISSISWDLIGEYEY